MAGPQEARALERSFRSRMHLADSAEKNEGCGHGQKRQEGDQTASERKRAALVRTWDPRRMRAALSRDGWNSERKMQKTGLTLRKFTQGRR